MCIRDRCGRSRMISALSSVSSLALAGLSFIQINPKQRGRTLKCRRTAWRSELSRTVDVYLPPGRGSAQEGRALRTTVLPCLVVQYAPHESRDEFEGTSFARGRGLAHVVPGFFFGPDKKKPRSRGEAGASCSLLGGTLVMGGKTITFQVI